MGKRKVKLFRVHAELVIDERRKLELMFSSTLERVTVRAVVDSVPVKPYTKSELFYDESGAYFILNGSLEGDELSYTKFYLDNFRRVRG